MASDGSTGQFGRASGQTPDALEAASRATPEGIFLARPEQVGDGIPLAVKDLFDTAGLTTTYGSAIFADHVPDADAEVVRRLEAAGYSNVGKTNLHEFAYGITSANPHFGTVPNPRAPGRIAGGSSGGSAAALAAGLAHAALGTDSGGSIRIPAACCGVVGFKPSYGLVSLDGCFPLAPSFDHAGPLGRTVVDCAAVMPVLADGFERSSLDSLDDLAVGVSWTGEAEPLVRDAVTAAASLFTRARETAFPFPEGVGAAFMREVAGVHEELFAENADLYGDNVRTKVEWCLAVTDAEYEAALRAREAYRDACEEAFAGLDLLLTPTLAFPPPPLPADDLDIREAAIRLTYPFNVLGWPVLALPCGPENELPVSLQVVGRDDALVLAAGELLEASLEHPNQAAARTASS
jgi:aspartyl-tRNA(Asn)/glutamyl-tRNA(Gln) amidotransferase subunit A